MSDLEPVIIGVADVVNRTSASIEPLVLISDAVDAAIRDAGSPSDFKAAVNELVVVKSWTWPYDDLPGAVAGRTSLGTKGEIDVRGTENGGDSPVRALEEVCRKIASGDSGVKVLAGGEALESLTAHAKTGEIPPPGWTSTTANLSSVFSPTTRDYSTTLGGKYGIGAPIQVYPLYENAFRARKGQSREENHAESAKLYAEFAKVAAGNENAWWYGRRPETEESIARVGGKNRMICYPYPLLMNALNTVNLAAAVIVTSVSTARRLRVPGDKWIYVLGAAGTSESKEFWFRNNYHHSSAIAHSIDTALSSSGLAASDMHLHDIYSCFPIVPKLAAQHLSLPLDGRLTLLGGLTFFGGAGNNYSMHALNEMTRRLRHRSSEKNGLVLANGGVLTSHYAAVLSSSPRGSGAFPVNALLPEYVNISRPEIVEKAEGDAVVETFTVDFARDGRPKKGHIVARLQDGGRCLASAADAETIRALIEGPEPVGRGGWVRTDSKTGLHVFGFSDTNVKL